MRLLWWCLAVVLAAGCSSSTGASPAASPSAVSAVQVLEKMHAALRSANTGRYSQLVVTDADGTTVTQTVAGGFDLGSRAWTARLVNRTSPPEAKDPQGGYVLDFIKAGDRAFLSAPGWPERLRGRWLRYEMGTQAESAAVPLSAGTPSPVSAVLLLEGTRLESTASGWVVTGVIPPEAALRALGLGAGVAKLKVDFSSRTGTAQATVNVGRDGLPTWLEIDATSVTTDPPLPEDLRLVLPRQRHSVSFTGFGSPVRIGVPTGERVIDPEEMSS